MAVSRLRRAASDPAALFAAFEPAVTARVTTCRDFLCTGGGGDNPAISVSNGNEPQSAASKR
jgi:hypothetical protein